MSNASNKYPACFDFQRNIVSYKGMQFPIRTIWSDDYNCNVLFSVVSLNDMLFDRHDAWSDATAEYIDNQIIYYVEEYDILQSDKYLHSLLHRVL